MNRLYLMLLILALLLVGCGQGIGTPAAAPETSLSPTTSAGPAPTATALPEYTWSQLLSRDAIAPIYQPEFVSADEAGYSDSEMVMGVTIEGESKAYPIGLLTRREMVNDQLAGIPILVTW